MDRRQQKTRKAIFHALSKLLEQKRFESITVQEIIDEADIGRSTFYAHFETKDDLLRSMCRDVFRHIFNERLPQESSSDFSAGIRNLELKLGHILYHLRENKTQLQAILGSESGTVFLSFLQAYLRELFSGYTADFPPEIPRDYLLCHLCSSFAEAVRWWMAEDTVHSPEEVASFFMAMIGR